MQFRSNGKKFLISVRLKNEPEDELDNFLDEDFSWDLADRTTAEGKRVVP